MQNGTQCGNKVNTKEVSLEKNRTAKEMEDDKNTVVNEDAREDEVWKQVESNQSIPIKNERDI